ncbi:nose resistant to fluoxetine protein 6-like isoform X2 [Wyeomyia smithii]|uniref:nose resistant to fluoxetine protein 6-like isoform X2 n=1 Tax=Wyeomyia smithii TaxID=174621 RepID=UPI002467E5AB|nr:nose resistant to fluoxetine protein 6-like isoform X2 [Wyeomyia smithii]XP_055533125.1 nose resistant to fluoxetine protein 6-like isoform X2 [Wyeomyia smithii]
MQQYHRMPKLSELDNYDQCLQEMPTDRIATYCMVRLVIKPDNRSDVWRIIEDFSSDRKRHYDHRHLARGVCVDHCKQLVKGFSNSTKEALRVKKFDIDFAYTFDTAVFKDTQLNRERYGDLLDVCLNYKLNQTHQLKAYTEIEVCSNNNEITEYDWLDILFLVVLLSAISLTVFSSWYDASTNTKQNDAHYKTNLDSRKKMIGVSFSILRNWYRLTSRSQDTLSKQLRFFQPIRFITMNLVILGHAALLYNVFSTQNTAEAEMAYHNIFTMLSTGGVQFTQTFFVMSGFLLAVHIMLHAGQRKEKLGFLYFLRAIFLRYIRLTPVYAFIILLHSTWLAKFNDGPLWKHGTDTERSFCRSNWWTNLLYVNNYVNANQPCVQQGWYLGCDFQLFAVGVLLMIIINRFRKFTVSILVTAVMGSYVIPALFVYYQKLEGVFLVTLEAQRFVFWFDDLYLKAYIPFHVNIGNYLAGIIAGLLFLYLQEKNINVAKKMWFCILWYLTYPVALFSLMIHYMFYVYDFEKPSIWMAIYFPLMKHSWGLFVGIVFLGFMHGIAPPLSRILDHRIFEPLGRISYAAYLCHVFVMRVVFLPNRSPYYFSPMALLTSTGASVVLSYLMAICLCLLLELPFSAFQKQLVGPLQSKPPSQDDLANITTNVHNNSAT